MRTGKVRLALGLSSMVLAVAAPCISQTNLKVDSFSLDARTSAYTLDTCEADPKIWALGEASTTLAAVGSYGYSFELFRGTTRVDRGTGWIVGVRPNDTVSLPYSGTVPAVSGTYTLKVYMGAATATGSAIPFTLKQGTGPPIAKSLINGDANSTVAVCPGGPITLDGSRSACASAYFVGIEFSDKHWTGLGGGGGVWLWEAPGTKIRN